MKFKILLIAFLCALNFVNAQNFFRPIPKLAQPYSGLFLLRTSSASHDSSIWALRPIVVPGAYAEPGNRLMAGAGISYQRDTWNPITNSWYCNYSINALGFAGGSVVPTTPNQITSLGLGIGILNNTILFGGCLTGNQLGAFISLGINFNN